MLFLLQFSFGWSSFQDIRNRDSRIAISEMRIIPTTRNSNTESVTRNSGNSNMMNLPSSVAVLKNFRIKISKLEKTRRILIYNEKLVIVLSYFIRFTITNFVHCFENTIDISKSLSLFSFLPPLPIKFQRI